MRISDLFIYPVKSARGVALKASAVDAFGLVGDRRAMVVAPDGQAITQRELPLLARITVEITEESLSLRMDGKSDVVVQRSSLVARLDVDIWKSIVSAAVADEATNRSLSGWLGRDVKLAIFDEASERIAEEAWVGNAAPVTFADGFQILLTTTGSLAALNEDLATHGSSPVGMDRFRPNIVIDCAEPWQEDRWAAIEIDGLRLDLVKPCARCIMITQDQFTGSRDVANPMPSVGRLRMSADRRVPGPLFGWNTVPRGEGMIEVGSTVKIIEERTEGWAFKRR
ncbi:MOSC domain-containing protein [Rhizobium tumorigenes]|uniref:MOSC domain-containing protein n=1 Tax=Rhizobium tumorigenes TaxID=2041385 RepID=A0AAF1K596_9HYPH|nr:MOSC domain-containing protein [Rhizobium tumorigenes]WFR96313.1 MOSC domain-containing protein [Rhizobium tumorigenes]